MSIKKAVYSALCLSLCMVLPFITGNIPAIGKMLSPMHIPAHICGFVCGPVLGLAVGFIAPLLRGAVFGMPELMPGGLSMAFELAVYGAVSGFLFRRFPKNTAFIYISLLISMVCGRIVWGISRFLIAGVTQTDFTFAMFIAGAITNAVPGIILQLIVIPPIVRALDKGGFIL